MTHLHGQISFVTILRADYVPNAAICESPAWGSRGGSLRPAYRATSRPAGVRPAVAIANPKVAILVPANALMNSNQEFMRRKGEETFSITLLAGTFTRSMKASTFTLKPNCIVYIIHLQ